MQLTPQTVKVLSALFAAPGSSGSDVCRATALASGTVYPILARLEDAGWLGGAWESGDPSILGRPRRRFYHLTAEGARQARTKAKAALELYSGLALT